MKRLLLLFLIGLSCAASVRATAAAPLVEQIDCVDGVSLHEFTKTAPRPDGSSEEQPRKIPTTSGVVRVGDIAPDFTLKSLYGQQINLRETMGSEATLLIFWSYFCFPCQAEMPMIEQLWQDQKDKGLSVITLALDSPIYEKMLLPFVEKNNLTFPVLYDKESAEYYQTAEQYGVLGTPTNFILDDTGRVRFIHLGRLPPDLLRGILRSVRVKSFCSDLVKSPSENDSPKPSSAQ